MQMGKMINIFKKLSKRQSGDLGVDGRIQFKWILRKEDVIVWTVDLGVDGIIIVKKIRNKFLTDFIRFRLGGGIL
jgi:hypothetical protein